MNQDEIREYLGARDGVSFMVASPGDGSPEMAWGDTFFFVQDKNGEPRTMPFVTIVIKDYEGFDSDSNLNRGGLYRLNMDVGKDKFEELFGFQPKELDANRVKYDFTALDQLFPHPHYGTYGWASIINPAEASRDLVNALLDFSWQRATTRSAV